MDIQSENEDVANTEIQLTEQSIKELENITTPSTHWVQPGGCFTKIKFGSSK